MDLGFADATAVVVGGGRGMGFAAARCLAEDGARVAVVGRTQDRARQGGRGTVRSGESRMQSGWSPTPPTPMPSPTDIRRVEPSDGTAS